MRKKKNLYFVSGQKTHSLYVRSSLKFLDNQNHSSPVSFCYFFEAKNDQSAIKMQEKKQVENSREVHMDIFSCEKIEKSPRKRIKKPIYGLGDEIIITRVKHQGTFPESHIAISFGAVNKKEYDVFLGKKICSCTRGVPRLPKRMISR
ncbi:MAG: hypothetical protein ABIJ28_00065 [Patescibacteria group bacterium]